MKNKAKRVRKMKVYVSIGSHGLPFMFDIGHIGERYPTLLHVYHKQVTPDLVPATLTFKYQPL